MFILREVLFVVLVLAPLFVALPLTVSGIKQKVRVSYIAGLIAIILTVVIGMIMAPFYLSGTYLNIVLITAFALGIYTAISYTYRRSEFYAYITAIFLTGIIATILIYSISNGYRDNKRSKVYYVVRESATKDIKFSLVTYAANRSFPAGYIDKNSPILTSLPAKEEKDIEAKLLKNGCSWKVIHRWHTPITGLYYVDRQKVHLWYPGGKIKDEIDNIRWQKKTGE